jgi:hypothetical protein
MPATILIVDDEKNILLTLPDSRFSWRATGRNWPPVDRWRWTW